MKPKKLKNHSQYKMSFAEKVIFMPTIIMVFVHLCIYIVPASKELTTIIYSLTQIKPIVDNNKNFQHQNKFLKE